MRNACRHTLVLLVISALLLAPTLAVAAVDLYYYDDGYGSTPPDAQYCGETTDRTSYGYDGATYDDLLWDYVYSLSGTGTNPNPLPQYWAITVDYAPVANSILQGLGWDQGVWDPIITEDEYGIHFNGSALIGRPGVVWQNHTLGSVASRGTFQFQSAYEPALRPWRAGGNGTDFDGLGSEWSASPEPASLLLSSLALLGVGYWRRRKTT